MGGSPRLLVGVLTVAALVHLARAGVITYNTDEVEEVAHSVQAQLDGNLVRLTVRREISNRGARADEALLELELPAGAAVVGLRAREGGDWRRGQLLEADHAEKSYQEPGERRARSGTGPVLLGWGFLGLAYAKLYPLAAGQSRELEYQLLAAPCYTDGAYAIAYPVTGEVTPRFDLDAGHGRAWVVDPQRPADPRWADIEEHCARGSYTPFQERVAWLVFEPPTREPVRTSYGRFAVSAERSLARVEIDVAPVLEPPPRRAQVVFAIDASRSVGEGGIAAELDLVRAYLARLPDAEFELVVYRRFPRRQFGRFQPARRAAELLAAIPPGDLEPGNGSHLERALGLAGSLLAGRRGPLRVIAFSDGLVRRALKSEEAAAALPEKLGAVVHVLQFERVDGERYWSQRRDSDRLAPVAQAHGGMLVAVRGQQGAAGSDEVMAGLVRPIQIDNFTLEAGGDPIFLAGDRGNVLAEGEGARLFAVLGGAPAEVVLRGNIWGREFVRRVTPQASVSEKLPALVFGDPIWAELDSSELTRAANAGGAVSAATSFLTGADSAVDLHAGTMGMGGGRVSPGQRFCCLYHAPPRPARERVVDRQAVLIAQLEPGVSACAAAHGFHDYEVKALIETTRGEIVDVQMEGEMPEAFRDCAEEQMWGLSLDGEEFDEPVRQFEVDISDAD